MLYKLAGAQGLFAGCRRVRLGMGLGRWRWRRRCTASSQQHTIRLCLQHEQGGSRHVEGMHAARALVRRHTNAAF